VRALNLVRVTRRVFRFARKTAAPEGSDARYRGHYKCDPARMRLVRLRSKRTRAVMAGFPIRSRINDHSGTRQLRPSRLVIQLTAFFAPAFTLAQRRLAARDIFALAAGDSIRFCTRANS
jgi:hypothetical protein